MNRNLANDLDMVSARQRLTRGHWKVGVLVLND